MSDFPVEKTNCGDSLLMFVTRGVWMLRWINNTSRFMLVGIKGDPHLLACIMINVAPLRIQDKDK